MNARNIGYIGAAVAAFVILVVLLSMEFGGRHGATSTTGGAAPGQDYIVVAAKPNFLFVVDPEARKVVHRYAIPGDGAPFAISTSPDGKIAYVLTDHNNGISGIDLDTGRQVFRAEFSTPEERVRSVGGIAVSADGREIFVQESPTKLLPSEYVVEPARVAVYRTDGGLNARPARTFQVPRRIIMLLPSTDGKILYALGWDMYALDPRDGHIISTQNIQHWNRPNASAPDILDVWPLFERSGVFSTPYYYTRTDVAPDQPGFAKTGILTLDLRTGAMQMRDFEDTSAVIFSSVVDPTDHDRVYGTFYSLSKIDLARGKLAKRIDLAHTYYAVNISSDGKELYLGGAMNDIAIYSTSTMKQIGDIKLAGAGDMAASSMRVIRR